MKMGSFFKYMSYISLPNDDINSDTNYASLRTREKDTRERVREFRALWAHYCEKAQMFQNTIKCNAMLFYLFS